ncbi:arf-GAP with Rho-GAP domain, ANK repeat and PH domain-containing protein 1-like [Dendronephthya gigantea]|uniref:arf-GAP with Rho-GAP domain, ANK repeat and PH domain-containing protein 1-like n=1 Tax=Dendronephthya gigantea TaxID=151771 RepID=UPI00106AD066|nr:arf-GAP with Rho-GAP domain, ANK repeat and PH domain-containing protein 1-like [Dendronephthya gigantea]
MMNESNTRKQDGDESFDLTEWLTNEVKLPQYRDVLLENGFELPLECSSIDETVLDKLGVVKIGHRKRLLVSCQKLADKWGLSSQDLAKPEKNSDASSKAGEQRANFNVDVQSPANLELPPSLPPKKVKKPRPYPPPRNMAEQEVNNDNAIIDVEGNSNVSGDGHDELRFGVSKPTTADSQIKEVKPIESTSNGGSTVHERTNIETLPPILSPDNLEAYEPIWEASEGEPQPKSPPISETHKSDHIDAFDNNANLDIPSTDKVNINNEEESSQHNQMLEQPNCSGGGSSGPPPIPPRSDLSDDISQETKKSGSAITDKVATAPTTVCESESLGTITTQPPKKKTPPAKPPRRNVKPMSMFVAPNEQPQFVPEPRRSIGSMEQTIKTKSDVIYENQITPNPISESAERPQTADEKRSVFNRVPTAEVQTDANLYDNAESFKKAPVKHTVSGPEFLGPEKSKKPKPVPRSRTLSDKKRKPSIPEQDYVYDVVADPGNDGGSCTEDDLSGSDREEMPERKISVSSTYEEVDKASIMQNNEYETPGVSSQYETVKLPRPMSVIQARHSTKEGYLFKQGGQQNNKGWKKRWVVFDGNELRYYKDKDHTHETLQRVGVAIMKEVRIVTEDTKRSRFDLACAGRTYMFALGIEEMDAIQVWAQILMSAIIQVRKEDETNVSQNPGGDMFEPDKKGFLKKQGNNVVADWKKRYVAVKDGMFAYYHNYEDFIVASPINTINMNLASVKVDPKSPNRLQLVTPHRTYLFQCDEEQELKSWVAALEKAIQLALSDKTVITKVWKNPSNRWCADCGERDPVWASINLVVCVCARCIGVHRNLGVHSSKPRSLLMDEKIWSPNLIRLMVEVGNEKSNKFWQFRIPDDDRITPESSSEERMEFIRRKYVLRMYRHVSAKYGDAVQLGEELKRSVRTNNIEKTMQLVFCGADVKYISSDGSETRTPYELAEDAKQELQMEFLMQNGAVNSELEPVHTPEPLNNDDNTYETVFEVNTTHEPVVATVPIVYEKEGFLHKKAPTAAVWRKRYFMLKGRELWYDKGDKDGHSLIKLKDVEEYTYNDSYLLDIVTAERTYNLRADTKADAFGWYTALRNKQVFSVPLECQELGSDGIPHLVAKTLQFVETHGLDAEGIYRKNGNKAKIKILKKLFNQDAESVMISREEYEAHDVAGLLKEYFRELPDPLMTEDAYAHFITASLSPDHNEKLHMYKDSLARLAEVNRTTLKAVINHLMRVSSHSQQNKMKLENISLIFGPTLMSNAEMGAMDTSTINQEFTVIGDFITYYKWLFDVGDDEMLKDQKIAEAMSKLSQLSSITSKSNLCEFNSLTLDIYTPIADSDSCRITVYSDTTASKICQELTSKKAMPPDLNWVLFQTVNEEIERPFPALEKVLDTVIETGKYTQLSKGSRLVVKENYLEDKFKAHGLQNDTSPSIGIYCQTMKEGKKKEKWKRYFMKLEKGILTVHKSAESKDEQDSWPLSETTLYIGVEKDKKPYTGYGFTIVRIAKDGQCLYRYVCFDDERELYRWIHMFLKLKYPQITDLWTDPTLEPIGYYAEALAVKPPLPRQRAPSNRVGGVSVMLNELKERQLRNSVRR